MPPSDQIGPIVIAPLDPAAVQPGNAPPKTADGSAVSAGLPYKVLKQTSLDYDGAYWHRLCAFYEGGKCLLNDGPLMAQVFPRHRDELLAIYNERKQRAVYVPYAAEIVDHIVASLTAQPLQMRVGGNDGKDSDPPPFYKEFFDDVSPEGGRRVTLNALLKAQVLKALVCRTAWTLVDLPSGAPTSYGSRLEQEKAGGLGAYCVPIDPMSIIDWDEDDSGELIWVVMHTETRKRSGVAGSRDEITKRWVYYTRTAWQVFELKHNKDKPPEEDDIIPMVDEGLVTSGRVPLERLTVPDGLWAMNKLEPLQRGHFNAINNLGWAETQSAASELYEFHGPSIGGAGVPISDKQEDPDRGTNQKRGQGYVQIRGADDRAEFVGPDTSAFTHLLASANNMRDEMHRVTHQMALSTDNGAAALKRSGESKAQDKAATSVILTALGQLVREHAEALLNLVSRVRDDKELQGKWAAKGMEKFDAVSITDMVAQAVDLETVSIPSPTFQRVYKMGMVKTILGDEATPGTLDAIEKELEENITAEQYDPANRIDLGGGGADPNNPDAPGDGGGGGDGPPGKTPPAPGPKKPVAKEKPTGGRMFDSRPKG